MNADTPEERTIAADWYRHSFGALYPILYAHRSPEAARLEAAFAAERVALRPSDAVLDLCCGGGRHMAALAEKTDTLTGLDYSPELLALAKQSLPPQTRLVRGDMRNLPFPKAFDVLFNFFTSFGYFQTRDENFAVLQGIARVLRPGGRFFFDYFHAEYTRQNLCPSSEREIPPYRVIEQRWIDTESNRVNKTTKVWQNDTLVARLGESVRLYTPEELLTMLQEAELEPDAQFGDYEGHETSEDYPRLIVVGHRKA